MDVSKRREVLKRANKTIYEQGDVIIKVFNHTHPKSYVFNEALNQARIEETGLPVPKVLDLEEIDGGWAIILEKKSGKTLEELMKEEANNLEKYMEIFVDAQLNIHRQTSPLLTRMKDKFARQINGLKQISATTRYELLTRLDGMKKHTKVCHGDYHPSNVIIGEDGSVSVIDWAHATQGNASGDAANTYLLFALEDQKKADLYLEIFCKKADIAKQYVEKWLSIVAAQRLTKAIASEEEFLMKWIDVVDYF